MNTPRSLVTIALGAVLLSACGRTASPDLGALSSPDAPTSTQTPDQTPAPDPTPAAGPTPPATDPGSATDPAPDPEPMPADRQPAVWPAPGDGAATPEAAAEAFVRDALGVPPTLGAFQQGDTRSGEIEVFSPGEGDNATPTLRGTLLLRQLGADDGWYVLAGVSEGVHIDVPAALDEVPAGELTVSGLGRGFEGLVVVEAWVAGNGDVPIDQATTTNDGAMGTPSPFSVRVDLAGTAPGTVVTLVARGGTGLETDPGEFAAIAVVVR